MSEKHYNYIITGGGASGLLLACRLAADPFFRDKKILLIDREQKTTNDRTWCFWEAPGGAFDPIVFKTWNKASFRSDTVSLTFPLHPFQYKMIRSRDFYHFIRRQLAPKPNITLVTDKVHSVTEAQEYAIVTTSNHTYRAEKVFNSILDRKLLYRQQRYPVLQQHFLGWFIRTESGTFDNSTLSFMDFTVPQQGNTRFMYVLPFSGKEALIEYTLFSKKLLAPKAYENAIGRYIAEMGIAHYTIMEKEQGSIPMTCYDFSRHNSKNILHIGTAGGWTKPSTGYTFLNAVRKTGELTSFLKKDLPLTRFGTKTRFRYYDLLFLDVLYHRNELGASIFSALFKRNTPERILRFLDEQTTFAEDLKILFSLPASPFIKSAFRRIF